MSDRVENVDSHQIILNGSSPINDTIKGHDCYHIVDLYVTENSS